MSTRPRSRTSTHKTSACDRILNAQAKGRRRWGERPKGPQRATSSTRLFKNKPLPKRENSRWRIERKVVPTQPVAPPKVSRGPSVLVVDETDSSDSCPEDEVGVPLNHCVVMDHGSHSIKAGFAGRAHPSTIVRTVLGSSDSSVVGKLAFDEHRRSARTFSLKFPIERGAVTNWSAMDEVWEHLLENEMKFDSSEHSILCTEGPLGSIRNRERLVETMFERFEAPNLSVMVQSVLSMYAAKKTTGIVVDVGFGVSSVVPCINGVAAPLMGKKLNLGGFELCRQINQALFQTLLCPVALEEGHSFVRDVKEKYCEVAPDVGQRSSESIRYWMPDGKSLTIGKSVLQDCSEIFFDPRQQGLEHGGIHAIVAECVSECDEVFQSDLLENIVVCGGTSLLGGFGERLEKEIHRKCVEIGVNDGGRPLVCAGENRQLFPWIGGSILASTGSNRENCFMSMEEFEEHGASIVHRKFCG